ncbi:hypothetical protein Tco_0671060 [Tanacetum coccineum]
MLNKDNYVPWSSRLLHYAKSKPNGKLVYNSIMNGPYIRRMIPEPGDPNHEVLVAETFHEQIDEELTKKELRGNLVTVQTNDEKLLIAQKEESNPTPAKELLNYDAVAEELNKIGKSMQLHLDDKFAARITSGTQTDKASQLCFRWIS